MKYGLMVGEGSGTAPDLNPLVARAKLAEESGVDTAWCANVSLDAITSAAVVGAATSRIEVGTAVTPMPVRHPVVMQQQAETAQLACHGRFTLGIGLAHRFLVERGWGLSYDRPAAQMKADLEALVPVLAGEKVACENDYFNVKLQPNSLAPKTEVLVAALGPMMLKLAGELSAGTITWATGPKAIADHIVPTISLTHATPRVVAGFPVALTSNIEEAREKAASLFAMYTQLPSYKAMLDREGIEGVQDLAIIGDEKAIKDQIDGLEEIGVTDFCGFLFETEVGEIDRTIRFLGSLGLL